MIDEFVALDTETTGLSHRHERIIEIGAVRVVGGEIRETYSRLVACPRPLEPRIVTLTGITDEMLKGAPELETVMAEFIHFCGDCPIAGHQLMFDYRFLKTAALSCQLPFEKTGLDSLKIAQMLHPELPSRKLSDLCDFYEIRDIQYHRAAADAEACARLLLAMADRYEAKNPALFEAQPLHFKAKAARPASNKQKAHLIDLVKYHKIDFDMDVDAMSMSEVTRMTDQIILAYGRMKK